MRNELRGRTIENIDIWYARQINDSEFGYWEGTGINLSGIVVHTDFRAALSFYLTQYPQTDTIQAVLDDQYRVAIPKNSAATTILDAIAKELGVE